MKPMEIAEHFITRHIDNTEAFIAKCSECEDEFEIQNEGEDTCEICANYKVNE